MAQNYQPYFTVFCQLVDLLFKIISGTTILSHSHLLRHLDMSLFVDFEGPAVRRYKMGLRHCDSS